MTGGMVLDLFAGPGGWSEGLRSIGLQDVGVELDRDACATRAAAGHLTIRQDVRTLDPHRFAGKVSGLIASPPCQDHSRAGSRAGLESERGALVWEVLRFARAIRPRWIAAEEVELVLPVWESIAWELRRDGYSSWAGVLCAADYGVPQTRRRAFLLASLDRPALPPEHTHEENPGDLGDLFGNVRAPWVTMADALGWTDPDLVLNPGRTASQPNRRLYPVTEPAPTVAFGNDYGQWCWQRPAPTVTGAYGRVPHPHAGRTFTTDEVRAGVDDAGPVAVKLTVPEALVLQGFRADYPVAGGLVSSFLQVGNAVPPPLAAAVVKGLTHD